MFEIEIKTLLGSKERADELKRRLVQLFPALRTLPSHKQRNFYFKLPSQATQGIAATTNAAHANEEMKGLDVVFRTVAPLLSAEKQQELSKIIQDAKSGVSIRTRDSDGKSLFILKASIGDDTSANGVSRVEFEEPVSLSFDELNQKLLDAGLTYQAKWSRAREHYDLGSIHITVDKNAGYGYLAEFEKMIDDGGEAEYAKQELKALMAELKCVELAQDRLERMFKHYNEHWPEYYGTEKTFTIE
ncbi:MAG: hypothetical protein Q7R93_04990 [bacterium]|nr:hypothetical protein [bacterium]